MRASLTAQLVKNPSAMQETPVWFLGREDLLERDRLPTPVFLGFPCGSAGKESTCNAGDPSSIPGSGRSPGEGKGYPLQYSWASLVAQLLKNLHAMWETWVQSLVWEDPLERGMAIYSSTLTWRIARTEELQSCGCRVRHDWVTNTHTHQFFNMHLREQRVCLHLAMTAVPLSYPRKSGNTCTF